MVEAIRDNVSRIQQTLRSRGAGQVLVVKLGQLQNLKGIESLRSINSLPNLHRQLTDFVRTRFGIEVGDILCDGEGKVAILSAANPSFMERIRNSNGNLEVLGHRVVWEMDDEGSANLYLLKNARNRMIAGSPESNVIEPVYFPPLFTFKGPNFAAWKPGSEVIAFSNDSYGAGLILPDRSIVRTSELLKVNMVSWKPDGSLFAAAGGDTTFKIINAQTMERIFTSQADNAMTNEMKAVAWSPDGRMLAAACGNRGVKVFDASNVLIPFKELFRLDGSSGGHTLPATTVAWSRRGRFLASGGEDQTVKIIDVPGRAVVFTIDRDGGHAGTVNSVAWYGERFVASGSDDKTVKITDLDQRKVIFTLDGSNGGHSDSVLSVAWNQAGFLATASRDGTVKIADIYRTLVRDPDQSLVLMTLKVNDERDFKYSRASSVVWSSDGSFLGVICYDYNSDGTSSGMRLKVYRFDDLLKPGSSLQSEPLSLPSPPVAPITKSIEFEKPITGILWSPDGKFLAVSIKNDEDLSSSLKFVEVETRSIIIGNLPRNGPDIIFGSSRDDRYYAYRNLITGAIQLREGEKVIFEFNQNDLNPRIGERLYVPRTNPIGRLWVIASDKILELIAAGSASPPDDQTIRKKVNPKIDRLYEKIWKITDFSSLQDMPIVLGRYIFKINFIDRSGISFKMLDRLNEDIPSPEEVRRLIGDANLDWCDGYYPFESEKAGRIPLAADPKETMEVLEGFLDSVSDLIDLAYKSDINGW